jgi:hypothetical protein
MSVNLRIVGILIRGGIAPPKKGGSSDRHNQDERDRCLHRVLAEPVSSSRRRARGIVLPIPELFIPNFCIGRH